MERTQAAWCGDIYVNRVGNGGSAVIAVPLATPFARPLLKAFQGEKFEQSRKPKNFRELSEQKRRGGDSNPR